MSSAVEAWRCANPFDQLSNRKGRERLHEAIDSIALVDYPFSVSRVRKMTSCNKRVGG